MSSRYTMACRHTNGIIITKICSYPEVYICQYSSKAEDCCCWVAASDITTWMDNKTYLVVVETCWAPLCITASVVTQKLSQQEVTVGFSHVYCELL